MSMHTHYQPITRDESGRIVTAGSWARIDCQGRQIDNGVSEHLRVLSVEPGQVLGWGGRAEAIGTVGGHIACNATRWAPACTIPVEPRLCFLGAGPAGV